MKQPKVIIVGGVNDYHVMDWYHTLKKLYPDGRFIIATDSTNSEEYKSLQKKNDVIESFVKIDKLLILKNSAWANKLRNFIKLLFIPLQLIALRKISKKYSDYEIHAHTMYSMLLCYLARIKFIGTPQGSEILIRPNRSFVYRFVAIKILKAASYLTVDSINMQEEILKLSDKKAIIIQNGVDTQKILHTIDKSRERKNVLSVRGITDLYRITEVVKARNHFNKNLQMHFIYPFVETDYEIKVKTLANAQDRFLGRLNKDKLYNELNNALLVISIPKSDSSPKTVYEAIFAGCCVAVTFNEWIEVLPDCMRQRLIIVDLNDHSWFSKAIIYAKQITSKPFVPSDMALNYFDQYKTTEFLVKKLYL